MSHDRGCPCGLEKYEYEDCTNPYCYQALKPAEMSHDFSYPVVVAEPVLTPWQKKVQSERNRLGRGLSVDELLELARKHNMTEREVQAQRESWERQDKD